MGKVYAHPNIKMSFKKARDARKLYSESNLSIKYVSLVFGLSTSAMQRLLSFQSWVE